MTTTRSRALDVLRGVAVVLVLFHHNIVAPEDAGALGPALRVLIRFGWTGVDLFFVLSGFLVGGLLLSEIRARGEPNVKRFFVRRLFKIWPSYYAYLAWTVVAILPYELAQRSGDGLWRTAVFSWSAWRGALQAAGVALWPNFLHVQNYWPTIAAHTWTLAVEEHFYLLLPLALFLVCRRASPAVFMRRFGTLAAIAIGLPIVLRVALSAGSHNALFQFTHFRLDGLFFGVWLAYLSAFRPDVIGSLTKRPVVLGALGLACIAPMAFVAPDAVFTHTAGYTLLYVGYGAILLACLRANWNGFAFRGVASVGVYSYTIYLWHNYLIRPRFTALVASSRLSSWPVELRVIVFFAGYVLAAYAIGVVASKMLEQPMLRLRDRLFPASRGSHAVPEVVRAASPGPAGSIHRKSATALPLPDPLERRR